MRAYTNAKPEKSLGKSLLEEARNKLIEPPRRAASARPAFQTQKMNVKNYQTLTVDQLRQMQADMKRQREMQEQERISQRIQMQKKLAEFAKEHQKEQQLHQQQVQAAKRAAQYYRQREKQVTYYTSESSVLQKLYEHSKMQQAQSQKLLAAQELRRNRSMTT